MENAYIVASLEDEKAKELGQIIANETTRKILNLLTKKNTNESEIAKELGIPISTVHYNIQQLLKAGLVKIKGFYYSPKGNKVNVYTLTRKLILIAPQGTNLVRSKIKNILPVLLITFGISVAIKLIYPATNLAMRAEMVERTAEGVKKVLGTAAEAAGGATGAVPILSNITRLATNYAAFFFGGSLLALLLYLLFTRSKAST